MTPEERLDDMEQWLQREYTAALAIWNASESPATRARMFIQLQTLQGVARHLITGRDDLVPLFNERLIIFTQHIDILGTGYDEGR